MSLVGHVPGAQASDLPAHLARFGRALRDVGVRVATGDEVDALQGLVRVDLADRDEVRWALRATLKVRPRDVPLFDAVFAELWLGQGGEGLAAPPKAKHGPRAPMPWPLARAGHVEVEIDEPEGDKPGASREALFRRKPFDACSDRDLHAMEPLLARLAARLATRRSRRLSPTRGPGRPDLRHSFRRAIATAGEVITLARRARPIDRPRLVFLCDTSGSMDLHTRFVVAFARALRRVAPATEVFAFGTALARVTPALSSGRLERVLGRLARAVPDWSGGTRIGESLDAFVRDHLAERVDSRTVVLIFSDGLEQGDPELLARSLRRIQARARRVIWLNPLLGDPRYEPTARGMAAALPYVDLLAAAHDLASLERLIPEIQV